MSFQWGRHDCCCFACSGLVVQGIINPMTGLKLYKTARGAASMIKRLGGTLDIAAMRLAARVGLYGIDPVFAGRGCPVLADVETPDGVIEPALGLVGFDGMRAFFAGENGLVWRRIGDCRLAWQFS